MDGKEKERIPGRIEAQGAEQGLTRYWAGQGWVSGGWTGDG